MKESKSIAERYFAQQLRKNKITGWVREYKFHPTNKKYRFDFAWVDRMVSLEIEGGVNFYVKRKSDNKKVRVSGKHTSQDGFTRDCVKYNEATILGWRVLRATTSQVISGQAIEWIERILN